MDVATRWNSTYNMIERFVEQRPSIYAALTELKSSHSGVFESIDFDLLSGVAGILKPFVQVRYNDATSKQFS